MSSDSQTKDSKKRPAVEMSDGEGSEGDFQPKNLETKSAPSKKRRRNILKMLPLPQLTL